MGQKSPFHLTFLSCRFVFSEVLLKTVILPLGLIVHPLYSFPPWTSRSFSLTFTDIAIDGAFWFLTAYPLCGFFLPLSLAVIFDPFCPACSPRFPFLLMSSRLSLAPDYFCITENCLAIFPHPCWGLYLPSLTLFLCDV